MTEIPDRLVELLDELAAELADDGLTLVWRPAFGPAQVGVSADDNGCTVWVDEGADEATVRVLAAEAVDALR